jgi:hypothetical protein
LKAEIERARAFGNWEDLVAAEEAAFQELCKLDVTTKAASKEKREAVRQWWQIINALVWRYVRTTAQNGTPPDGTFPAFALGRLANIAEELGNGVVPTIVEDARSGGRPLRLGERRDIARALYYLIAVREGRISDRAPVLTVARAFNVTRKAVQKWQGDEERLCVGVPGRKNPPDQIIKSMQDAGLRYSRLGRGAPSEL